MISEQMVNLNRSSIMIATLRLQLWKNQENVWLLEGLSLWETPLRSIFRGLANQEVCYDI